MDCFGFEQVVLLLAASVASSAAAAVPGTHRIVVPVAVAVPVVTASQYHAQDESGRASFGYAHPGHVAAHRRDHLGHQVLLVCQVSQLRQDQGRSRKDGTWQSILKLHAPPSAQ